MGALVNRTRPSVCTGWDGSIDVVVVSATFTHRNEGDFALFLDLGMSYLLAAAIRLLGYGTVSSSMAAWMRGVIFFSFSKLSNFRYEPPACSISW